MRRPLALIAAALLTLAGLTISPVRLDHDALEAGLAALNGDASDKQKLIAAMRAVKLTDTPRGPSSLASIKPLGPPPTMRTSVSITCSVAFMGSIWILRTSEQVYPRTRVTSGIAGTLPSEPECDQLNNNAGLRAGLDRDQIHGPSNGTTVAHPSTG